ncbi:hypothetical protein GYN08_17220 [Saccharibacillus sp. VR-M41]|uniref:Uncharacterized protein n=1 Tax=Saccharibacillus alkalitolerans TaxID=2705290 RepID=A0ABX0FAQ8_9BACL|nr:hypothetical protein [Saccharibacillus alkalitolerans]
MAMEEQRNLTEQMVASFRELESLIVGLSELVGDSDNEDTEKSLKTA